VRGPCSNVPDGAVFGAVWTVCPIGETRNPLWQAAVNATNLAQVSPLSGWPDTYSAGVCNAILALKCAPRPKPLKG
tara:strand:+ start:393 stop:620 length:228 start_codon:yes stop_codon:yes gene_type:complete